MNIDDRLLLTRELLARIHFEQNIDVNKLRKQGIKYNTIYQLLTLSPQQCWIVEYGQRDNQIGFAINTDIALAMRDEFVKRYRSWHRLVRWLVGE